MLIVSERVLLFRIEDNIIFISRVRNHHHKVYGSSSPRLYHLRWSVKSRRAASITMRNKRREGGRGQAIYKRDYVA